MSLKSKTNTQVIYKQIPKGLPIPDYDFQIKTSTFVLKNVVLGPNEMFVRILYLSVDPYMRARMRDPAVRSYSGAFIPGKPLEGGAIGEILKSNDPKFPVGHFVVTFSTWEEYAVVSTHVPGTRVILDAKTTKHPLSYYLGILGMPGMTAYAGLHKICEPLTPGQTLFVSAASGAVGHVVGQYAKSLGLRVVGSCGSEDKVNYLLNDLGFDAAFNYKEHQEDLVSILKETCPQGIDIYFENVGGRMLDAVLAVANDFCRIAVCGMISQYNRQNNPEPQFNLSAVISKRIRMEGFIVSDEMAAYGTVGMKTLTKLVQQGTIKYKETVTEGIQNAPQAFVDMLTGKNTGKAVVKVADL